MLLLDTSVLAELMRPSPAPKVASWVSAQAFEHLFTAAACQAEILAAVAILPEGRRRTELSAAAEAMFATEFAGRVLPFDGQAAAAYASLFALRRRSGRPAATIDVVVAAIALSRGASLVTRNLGDFSGCGVLLINPWH